MKEHEETEAGAAARAAAGGGRAALLLRAGGRAFAVYADECEAVTPWAEPAPLPGAPAAVLGVTPVRGRMRTVLDPARLFESAGRDGGAERPSAAPPPRLVASLAGDEQLALAIETSEAFTLTPDEEAAAAPPASPALPARAAFARGGETVHLLDPARLFDAAMSGAERRRSRSLSRE